MGDKVVEEGSTALNWTASNASTVSIDQFGKVDPNGTRTLPIAPKKTDPGPVDETVSYTLSASNECGGSETKTATLHIVGLIEVPDTGLALNSVFFPTDVPRSIKTKKGLVLSQQATLTSVADAFKKYLENKPDAHLTLIGHADQRGENGYNKALSERRAEVAKDFLIAQGVSADHLETQGLGDDQNLTGDQVKQSIEQNPELNGEIAHPRPGQQPSRGHHVKYDRAGIGPSVSVQNRRFPEPGQPEPHQQRNRPYGGREKEDGELTCNSTCILWSRMPRWPRLPQRSSGNSNPGNLILPSAMISLVPLLGERQRIAASD